MLRAPRDLAIPDPKQLQDHIERTEALLKELHQAMMQPAMSELQTALADPAKATNRRIDSQTPPTMREPIFYGAESAYSFQYRDFAVQKYVRDKDWLDKNKGFSPEDGRRVVVAIRDFLNEKLLATLKGLKGLPLEQWTILNGFTFSVADIAAKSGLPSQTL